MYKKVTVTLGDFIDSFEPDCFSCLALYELFEHLEQVEYDSDEQHELDPDAICRLYYETSKAHVGSEIIAYLSDGTLLCKLKD